MLLSPLSNFTWLSVHQIILNDLNNLDFHFFGVLFIKSFFFLKQEMKLSIIIIQ